VLKFGKKIQKLISYFGKEKKKRTSEFKYCILLFSFDEFCNWGKNEGPQ
jgi:hypothetical protein